MKLFCFFSYIIFFTLISFHNHYGASFELHKNRDLASYASCREFISPFITEIKHAGSYQEIIDKGYLSFEEINLIKTNNTFKILIDRNSTFGEDRDFAYAVLALIKKKYPRLSNEGAALHYEAILRFCI